jgi:hypothetical protein
VDRSTPLGAADLFARIVLPRTTLEAGSSMEAQVVVENGTGHDRVGLGGSPFAVVLANDDVKPSVVWPACAQRITIPPGESIWPVTVNASYAVCGEGEGLVPCLEEERMPPLPPGDYRALLVQHPRVVPDPDPVLVHVMPPG